MCVEVMLASLGVVAVTPHVDFCLLAIVVCGNRKCPVQHVSAMAMDVDGQCLNGA